jgi:sugar-phosphatase
MTGEVTLDAAAVLFDLDGVLVDSRTAIERSWLRWAAEHGVSAQVVLAACHGRPSAETIAAVAGHLDAEAEAARLERRQATDTAELTRCPGAARLLTALPPGRWAIVTSGTRPLAFSRLRAVRLAIPDVLVTADDVAHGKPAPEGYLQAAARLGVPPGRCVVVEDSASGVRAGRAAGCRVVGIAGDQLGDAPDVIVSSLADLTARLADGEFTLHVRHTAHV